MMDIEDICVFLCGILYVGMAVPIKILYVLCQWTWGVVQNIVGLLVFLVTLKNKHSIFRCAVVTHWNHPYSMGCGMFIFKGDHGYAHYSDERNEKINYDVLVHEYGHTVQSLILGPLFVPVIAIPSLLWASIPYFDRLRSRRGLSYYWLYCEKWANLLGDKVCGNIREKC